MKLIRRVYEIDPLLCPFCGAEMKTLAFILDFATAKAILKSLKFPVQEPEPLAHAPPETVELIAECESPHPRCLGHVSLQLGSCGERLDSQYPPAFSTRVQGGRAGLARSNWHPSGPSAPLFRLNTLALRNPISYSSAQKEPPLYLGVGDLLGAEALAN